MALASFDSAIAFSVQHVLQQTRKRADLQFYSCGPGSSEVQYAQLQEWICIQFEFLDEHKIPLI
jgi:hypothetical protein